MYIVFDNFMHVFDFFLANCQILQPKHFIVIFTDY